MSKQVREQIAKNILFFRKQRHLTQKDVATSLNTSVSTVSSWERGANSPDLETLVLLCNVLNVGIDTIFGVSNPPKQTNDNAYSPDERYLIDIYRTLNEQGKEHIRICATSAQALFKEKRSDISFMESKA